MRRKLARASSASPRASSPAASLFRRSFGKRRDRVDVYFDDGSMVSFVDGLARGRRRCSPLARDALARRPPVSATDRSPRRSVEHAYLEGDFLLRSGKRSKYYLDKYRFETRPELLRPLGERIAAIVREHAPDATRLAGPELGAVALAASASLASGLPFLIVRKAAKEYGTAKRHRRRRTRRANASASSRTSSPPAARCSSRSRRCAQAGLVVHTAVCVVDREEGGADALARHAVRLRPLFRAGELLAQRK